MAFYTVPITPHPAQADLWLAGIAQGEGWHDAETLVSALAARQAQCIELHHANASALRAQGIKDIRGTITGEPPRIFALQRSAGAEIEYVGIVEGE
ncbi:MAG: hypothetical protein AB7N91_28220 [Candidatus Tectimicrobiota bacterium]